MQYCNPVSPGYCTTLKLQFHVLGLEIQHPLFVYPPDISHYLPCPYSVSEDWENICNCNMKLQKHNEWRYPYTWELQLLLLKDSSDIPLHPQTLQGGSRMLTENPAWKLRKKNSGLPETPENVRSRCSVMYTSSLSREPLGCISWIEEVLNFGEVGHWLLVARLEHNIELFVLVS